MNECKRFPILLVFDNAYIVIFIEK